MNGSWAVALLATLGVGAGVAFALRPGSLAGGLPWWAGLALPYVALAALAARRLGRKGALRPLLRFRPGDPSLGILFGAAMVVAAWALARWLWPRGSVAHAWLARVFAVMGEQPGALALVGLVIMAALEELVWRGLVQTELSERLGPRRGWIAGAVLYAAAHLPALQTLADASAGPNPLLVLAALGCGLCWAFLRERSGRLWPGMFAHAAFTHLAVQYLPRFL